MLDICEMIVTAVNIGQVVTIEEGFEVKAYYAGHVLGAAMFHVRVG
jgi:integrator complex subunit 11